MAAPDLDGRSAGKFADLRLRAVSAVAVAALALGCIWLGGIWIALLALVAVVAMALELRSIACHGGDVPDISALPFALAAGGGVGAAWLVSAPVGLAVLGAGALVAAAIDPSERSGRLTAVARLVFTLVPAGAIWLGIEIGSAPTWVAGAGALMAMVFLLYTGAERSAPIVSLLGTLYIGAAGIAFVALREVEPFGFLSILWAGLVVVAADVGGYFAGRLIGGPRLWPRVSPKKTWAGLGGGVALAFLVGGLFSWATTGTYFVQVCTVSAIAALLAQGGDLAESALKRHYGVKDAGRLMPGHGGVMDRLDGHMAAILVAALVTFWRGEAVFVW